VINLSLGGTGPSSVLEDAINYAHGKGAIVIAAAGNKGSNFVLYPARSSNVIAVARTNGTNNWESSNYGPEIDLAAPGSMIYSTVIGGYNYNSGTSMAAGYVSGLAAILMGIPGNSSPDLIETQMESTALDIEFGGWDEYTGAGLIQMDAAIQMAWTPTPTPNVDGQNQPFAGSGNIPEFVSSSNTPLPTIILSSTPPLSTETVVLTFETASTNHELGTITSTPIKEEFEVGAQGDENSSNTYTLPCIGTLFILSGAIWVWFLTRKRNFS